MINYNSKWLNYAVILVIIMLFYHHKTFNNLFKVNQDTAPTNAKYTVKVDLSKKNEERSWGEKLIYSLVDDDIKRKTNPEAYKDALPKVGKDDLIVLDIKSEKELAILEDPNFYGPPMPSTIRAFTMNAHQLDQDWEDQINGMVLGEIKMISTNAGKYRIQVIDIKNVDK